jgi:two-component system cell cycle sensor histidine kinase/response regulator CckA
MNTLTTIADVTKTHALQLPHAAERRPYRVLVVDDDPSMLQFENLALVAAGYDTTLASDGPAALTTSQTNGPFDVLLTDVMMPQMRGDELARRVRQKDPATKILYITGYSDKLFEDKCRLYEYEAFLNKPCTPDGLLEAMSMLLNGRIRQKTVWG